MRKGLAILGLVLGISFTLSSCMTYEDIEMEEITNVDFKKISAKRIKVIVSAKINNPNNYPITIVKGNLDIHLSGMKIGTALIEDKVKLPKNSRMVHEFGLETDLASIKKGLMGSVFSVLTDKAVPLRLLGAIKARVVLAGKKFEVDYTEPIKVSDYLF